MTEDFKPLKVVLAPGVLEQMEAMVSSPEELQELLDEIKAVFDDPDFMANSEPLDLDQLAIEEPDVYEAIRAQIERLYEEEQHGTPPTVH